MNFNKFYELAKQNGLEVAELTQSKSSTFSIEIFKKEITSYSFKDTSRLTGRGIYNGKLGFVTTEKDDATTPLYIINSIKDAASVINSDDEAIIYKGAEKYKNKNVFNKELSSWAADDILKILFEIEEKLYAKDPRITDVEVAFERVQSALTFSNSYGLLIKNKSNFFDFVASITIKDREEVKSSFNVFLDNKIENFNIEEFVNETVRKGVEKFHGETIAPGAYNAVLSREVVDSLLCALISNASAEEVQKHSSSFEGKLNQKVFSDKITIEEKPLANNIFYDFIDDEGVPKQNKFIVKKGVLTTYLHNLGTAKKD
ncbi:MAG: TldD/PmbA family protein, partial [Candidatus Onthovivens sp.]